MKSIEDQPELERLWPANELLDAVGFRPRVHGRVAQYLQKHSMVELSPKQLMDLFLPMAFSGYYSSPISSQPQFGWYCYNSALLSLCDASLGTACRTEWASRIYALKVWGLRRSPANRVVHRQSGELPPAERR